MVAQVPEQQELLVYQAARQEAQRVLEAFGEFLTFPINLLEVSRLMNARMRYDEQLTNDISGLIVKNPGEPAQILINPNEPLSRQRFTWAHELGHLAERTTLAADYDYSFVDLRKPGTYDSHEFYADEFAGALLMPHYKIEEMQNQGKGTVEMAKYFGVSYPAMTMRLHRLAVAPEG